jgi:hypothetical protein
MRHQAQDSSTETIRFVSLGLFCHKQAFWAPYLVSYQSLADFVKKVSA